MQKIDFTASQSGSRGARFLRNFCVDFFFAQLFFREKKNMKQKFRKKRDFDAPFFFFEKYVFFGKNSKLLILSIFLV
tara:strand:+ start:5232 stop:5462 length:231 start_codon:yes stop_codon:yes gene_type:complete